ncbi:MAG TPA: hypothetical protein VF461_19455 [Gemmatimonadaceae bacterium]
MNTQLGPSRVSLRVVCCTLLVAALTYACGGGNDTPTKPTVDRTPIKVVAGGGQTDTIGAVLLQALVVEVRDTSGKFFAGSTVRFTPVGGISNLLVSPVSEQNFAAFASDVADTQGRAKALVKMGNVAGTMKLEIAVPELGAVDTITFVVKAGAPAKFTISPRDTTLLPGASFTLSVQTTDRASNPIPSAAPTFSATGATVTSAGLVTAGSSSPRAHIIVSHSGAADTVGVWVVMKLPMVMNRNHAVVLINSDGTGATTLATSPDNSLSPSSVKATPQVLFYQGDPGYSGTIWTVQPNGTPQRLNPGTTRGEGWARFSPDGAWVYFTRDYRSLWREHLDGTGLDSLTSFTEARVYIAPSVSPDGHSVAIEDGTGVQIYDATTRTPRMISTTCGFPTYSPDGAWFACTTASTVSVVRTDGTGKRLVANLSPNYGLDDLTSADWTADGTCLLLTTYTGAILVDVSNGAVFPLTGLGMGFFQASIVR